VIILILAAGKPVTDINGESYPICLAEFNGTPLIEKIFSSCKSIEDAKYVVTLKTDDIKKYHLDNIVSILQKDAKIVEIPTDTNGAACTALLAITHIDTPEDLLIINCNEILDENFSDIIDNFKERNLDAGIVTFSSVHPRYSYVRTDSNGYVIEASEKNPISRQATVGFYWFAHGNNFISATKDMIRKDASVNSLFYICPSLNELILKQARIGTYSIAPSKYHPLKNERQRNLFESSTESREY